MPKRIERKLRAEARKKNLGKKRTNAYVYGTLRKMGWRPKPKSIKATRKASKGYHGRQRRRRR